MSENLPIDLNLDKDKDDLQPLECDKEVKAEPEKTIAERKTLNFWKRKIAGTRSKILNRNKLLTRLPMLLAQIKSGNDSYK